MAQTVFRIVNLEDGRPTLKIALYRLDYEIKYCRRLKIGILKLIHGYGSSGAGGRLRVGVRERLEELKTAGVVKFYVRGEDFSIFNADTIKLLDACDPLRREHDLNRSNNGVTYVML